MDERRKPMPCHFSPSGWAWSRPGEERLCSCQEIQAWDKAEEHRNRGFHLFAKAQDAKREWRERCAELEQRPDVLVRPVADTNKDVGL